MALAAMALGMVPSSDGRSTTAPYHHVARWAADAGYVGGCALSRDVRAAGWSPSSGRGVFAGTVTARTCGSPTNSGPNLSTAGWAAYWAIVVPFRLAGTSPNASVTTGWSLRWTADVVTNLTGNCSGRRLSGASYAFLHCAIDASVEAALYTFVYDASANLFYAPTTLFNPSLANYSSVYQDVDCSPHCVRSAYGIPGGGTLHGSSFVNLSFRIPGANRSHTWEVYAWADASAYVEVETIAQNFSHVVPLAGAARASLDVGRGGNGIVLGRISTT